MNCASSCVKWSNARVPFSRAQNSSLPLACCTACTLDVLAMSRNPVMTHILEREIERSRRRGGGGSRRLRRFTPLGRRERWGKSISVSARSLKGECPLSSVPVCGQGVYVLPMRSIVRYLREASSQKMEDCH